MSFTTSTAWSTWAFLPEDEALRALFDRFLLRCPVDNLRRESMPRLLRAGWELERSSVPAADVSSKDLRELSRRIYDVDLGPVREVYAEVVFKIRDLGVAFSDRRAVKGLKLVAASALLCGRLAAAPCDLWVLRYVLSNYSLPSLPWCSPPGTSCPPALWHSLQLVLLISSPMSTG